MLSDQQKQNIVNAVGSALMTCGVLGGVCGFLYIARAVFHPESVVLKFTILYPADEVSEAQLIRSINQYISGERTVNHKQFEAKIALIDDTIKGNSPVSLFFS